MTTTAIGRPTYCKTCYQNDCICEVHMDGSEPSEAFTREENRRLKKILIRFMRRDGMNNATFGRMELDYSDPEKLTVITDSAGNEHLHLES